MYGSALGFCNSTVVAMLVIHGPVTPRGRCLSMAMKHSGSYRSCRRAHSGLGIRFRRVPCESSPNFVPMPKHQARTWSSGSLISGVCNLKPVQIANFTTTGPAVARERSSAARKGGLVWIAALVATFVPAFAYANFILNHFYVQGAFFWDSGVVAGVIWRRDAWLTYAPLWPVGSLYAYHVMPLLSLLTLASRYVPIGLPGWFALITGIGHALPAAGVFGLLTEGLGLHSRRGLAISVVVAIGFAFTGIPLATILFPHPEIFLAGGLILVCAAVALERYSIAAVGLVLTMLVREDAGFHAFGILFLLGVINWWRDRPWREQRPLLLLASFSVLYSVGAFLFKQIAFPDQPPLFASEYIGNPPFNDIVFRNVLLDVAGMPFYRPYFFWPWAVALIWAIRSRNVLIALGYLACFPWFLLHVMANRDILQTISGYYSFPFLMACAWPLAAVVIDARQRGSQPDSRTALAGFTIMLVLSFLGLSKLWNPGHADLWTNFTTRPSLERERATGQAVAVLLAGRAYSTGPSFGTTSIDQSVYSFAPYSFDATTVVGTIERTVTTRNVPADTIAYFESGIDIKRVRDTILLEHLTHAYRFKDTSIRLASNRNLDGAAGLESMSSDADARK
jgi:hypothetical protein